MIKVILLLLLSSNVFAGWVYQEEGKDGYYSDYKSTYKAPEQPQLKYNAFEKEWSYQPKENVIKYNAFEQKHEYAPPTAQPRYNALENRWEMK
jgi:hypothetical protein